MRCVKTPTLTLTSPVPLWARSCLSSSGAFCESRSALRAQPRACLLGSAVSTLPLCRGLPWGVPTALCGPLLPVLECKGNGSRAHRKRPGLVALRFTNALRGQGWPVGPGRLSRKWGGFPAVSSGNVTVTVKAKRMNVSARLDCVPFCCHPLPFL